MLFVSVYAESMDILVAGTKTCYNLLKLILYIVLKFHFLFQMLVHDLVIANNSPNAAEEPA